MSINNIDLKEVLAIDGGLRYILHRYPNAADSENQKNKKFKLRDSEKTASASLKQLPDGKWGVTDFGGDAKMMDAIRVAMFEDGTDFRTALMDVAAFYEIGGAKVEAPRADFNEWPAKPDEQDGVTTYRTKELTEAEIRSILTDSAWRTLHKDEDKRLANAKALFALYHLKSLEYKRVTSKGRTMEFRSNERYPMFIYEEGTEKERWGRFYEPKADKKYRFFYIGEKPKVFIHGMAQAHKKYDEMNLAAEEKYKKLTPEQQKTARVENTKLKEIINCSGGSDALNVAALGYQVVWRNSETEEWTAEQYVSLKKICDNFYNLPDIDVTGIAQGHKMALQFLDMKTIWLPERIQVVRDPQGNALNKDLRDFLRFHRGDNRGTYRKSDFEDLVKTALPYEFWDVDFVYTKSGEQKVKYGRPVMEYKPNNLRIYNFLYRMGFCRLKSDKTKEGHVYVHVKDNIVRELLDPSEMVDFVDNFLESRFYTEDLRNAFLRSPQLNVSSLAKIRFRELDFSAYGPDYQYLFFDNVTWKVSATAMTELPAGATGKYVWEDKVLKLETLVNNKKIQHKAKREEPFFNAVRQANGQWTVDVLRNDCMYLNFLIQTCRVHWREELEERLEFYEAYDTEEKRKKYITTHMLQKEQLAAIEKYGKDAAGLAEYMKAYKFHIAGELLTAEEKLEQQTHLANRLYVMGYMLHRWKDDSKPWAVWTMDSKLSEEGESHGGSGKSLVTRALKTMLRVVSLPGRNEKMMDNDFVFENVTKEADMVLTDDTHQHMPFDRFFEPLATDMVVNRKNVKSIVIPFQESPKFWFNSNYGDKHLDPSSQRRKIYTVFSDYYHKNSSGNYREDRDPKVDFGNKNLFGDFDAEQWNLFYNLMAYALQFYLSCQAEVRAPEENVSKRNLMAQMGDNFKSWADVYFSRETKRLDTEVVRDDAQADFFRNAKMTPQSFLKKLKVWCKFYGYVFNPVDMQNASGRIIKNVDGASKEVIYIHTVGPEGMPQVQLPIITNEPQRLMDDEDYEGFFGSKK